MLWQEGSCLPINLVIFLAIFPNGDQFFQPFMFLLITSSIAFYGYNYHPTNVDVEIIPKKKKFK